MGGLSSLLKFLQMLLLRAEVGLDINGGISVGTPDTTSRSKVPIDDSIYSNIVHYAAFPQTSYNLATQPCKNLPFNTVIVKYFNITLTDTQAILFRDDSAKEFILGIPGTEGLRDQITDILLVPVPYISPNADCYGICLVHLGFLFAWNSLADAVISTLKESLEQHPDYGVVISGHSLGGSLAQLAYASLKPVFPVKAAYTYGQPRVGNFAFAKHIDQLSGATSTTTGDFHRVTHFNDGVPNLIPRILGYTHSLTEFWESTQATGQDSTFRCFGHEAWDCNDPISDGLEFANLAHLTYAGLQYDCNAGS